MEAFGSHYRHWNDKWPLSQQWLHTCELFFFFLGSLLDRKLKRSELDFWLSFYFYSVAPFHQRFQSSEKQEMPYVHLNNTYGLQHLMLHPNHSLLGLERIPLCAWSLICCHALNTEVWRTNTSYNWSEGILFDQTAHFCPCFHWIHILASPSTLQLCPLNNNIPWNLVATTVNPSTMGLWAYTFSTY